MRIQRQRRVLYERLKVPPAINLVRGGGVWAPAAAGGGVARPRPRPASRLTLRGATASALPPLAQFRSPLDKAESFPLFSLLAKYSPEGKAAKEARIEKLAAEKVGSAPLGLSLFISLYLSFSSRASLAFHAASTAPPCPACRLLAAPVWRRRRRPCSSSG